MTQIVEQNSHLLDIAADCADSIAAGIVPDAAAYGAALAGLLEIHEQRRADTVDFSTYALPQLPERDLDEVFWRVEEAERGVAAPNLLEAEYRKGTAGIADQLLVEPGKPGNGILLTAEHATDHWYRDREAGIKPADYGTGGLAVVLQEKHGTKLVLPRGMQTGNANSDVEEGKLKREMRFAIWGGALAHISVHGMGRVAETLTDTTSFGLTIGVGDKPSDETMQAAETMQGIALDLGLRTGSINQEFISFAANPHRPRRNADGSMKRLAFAARGEGTTRYFAQEVGESIGRPLVAIQVELVDAIRLLPIDYRHNPRHASQRIGVWLGHKFMDESLAAISKQLA